MNEKKSQKILVSGATGFVGSHLVEALIREGYPITLSCKGVQGDAAAGICFWKGQLLGGLRL